MRRPQSIVWLIASLLLLIFASHSFAECVPLDSATREDCVKLILNKKVNNEQLTNLRWHNRCDIGISVKWSAVTKQGEPRGLTESAPARGTVFDQCYSFCGEISWHAICPNQSSINKPKNIKLTSRDATFCSLFSEAQAQFHCHEACAQSAAACNNFRTDVLPQYQGMGLASYSTSGSSHSSGSRRSCPPGERLWSCDDGASLRCLSNPNPVGCGLAE
jgi:hypothetical protein